MGIENVGGEDYKEVRKLAKRLGIELKFSYKRNVILKTNNKKERFKKIFGFVKFAGGGVVYPSSLQNCRVF